MTIALSVATTGTPSPPHLSFDELYQRYARLVHGILLARVPPTQVEDLKQDVFVTAFQHLDSLRDENAIGGWLATVARNKATDWLRRQPRLVELDAHHQVQKPAPPEALRVLDLIRALPDAYRETLILRLVEGLTGPEIAEQTGLTPDSVRVNLHRGMKLLKEKLA
jgi:RNA polymerase sigma-70 factor (ECF subfamily)